MAKRENEFQPELIKELNRRFPGCLILKNDPTYIQGIPDLLVLKGEHWVALETKRSRNAAHQRNQNYYVNLMNDMSMAYFVDPANKEEVLDEIQRAFATNR